MDNEKKPTEVKTFCRVCEPFCGVIATVEDGRITKIKSNPDHVHSRGHFCKKAQGAVDITYDPDRVLYPLKRSGKPGEFTRISWEQAYGEIGDRLGAIRKKYGPAAFATYQGNPSSFSYATTIALAGFQAAMGVKWRYSVNGEDANALLGAMDILYGSPTALTKPDIWRSSFVLIVGSNPVVSHGSAISEPRIQMALKDVVNRGGRVIVVDPRLTETAQQFEHVPIRAGGDAWFLSAMLREMIDLGFTDQNFITKNTRGFEALRELLSPCSPEWAEQHSGIPAQTIRDLARSFGESAAACVLGRTGTCTQRYGTFSTMLMQLMTIVTGNLDRAGGNSFGWPMMGAPKFPRTGTIRSRSTNLPNVLDALPSAALASDIETPGEGQVKALLVEGANPVLQSPAGGSLLETALEKLELHVAIDLYVNETNRYADYILPSATMWEREDVPLLAMSGMMLRPSVFATAAVVERRGEAKDDWEILYEICRRAGVGAALPLGWMRWLAKIGFTITPRHLIDLVIRTGKFGDYFGLKRGGLSFRKLLDDYPDGVALMEFMPVGVFSKQIATQDRRIDLASPEIRSEFQRMLTDQFYLDGAYPLRLHTLRELLTHNSWMHNATSLARSGRTQFARLNPADALRNGIAEGDLICIRSPYGSVEVVAGISDKVSQGNVAMPHGWGHNGGWKVANARGGVNSNTLASPDPSDADPLSGSSTLNGIPVSITKIVAQAVG